MSVLRSLESKIADLVEGTFGRVFRSEVKPVEIARKLAREMDEHRTESLSRIYAPNEYIVWLSPEDRARYEGVETSVIDELAAYLLEHARSERLALVSRPGIEFRTDERLTLGEFGIQVRLVRPAEDDDESVEQAGHGHTMVYSGAERLAQPLEDARRTARRQRAIVTVDGKRMLIGPHGAVVGRSRDCDIMVANPEVSRRHAEISPTESGWIITDLGSTNGVRVNGRTITAPYTLAAGDVIELGNAEVHFEVE
jgi:hypothetical protein